MDMRLEIAFVPVTDVDRAKSFYVDQIGFVADFDVRVNPQLRFVQLTPPGSACSIAFGEGITESTAGSQHLQLVIDDAEAAHAELSGRGVSVSDVTPLDWGTFVYFSDPDGNRWALQQIPDRSAG